MAGNFWLSSHCEQWILDKQDILRMRGEDLKIITEDEYTKIMIFFCNFIHAIGTDGQSQPKMRMQVIATACVYFRRFYARRSLKDIDPFLLAPTTLFLASKVEEHGMMSTSKLTTATNNALKKWPCIQQELVIRPQNIQEAEFILIEIMDCSLIVYHPYRYAFLIFRNILFSKPMNLMINDMKSQLIGDMKREQKDSREQRTLVNVDNKDIEALAATGWKICNDCTRTDLSLMYPPYQIAIACLLVASIWINKERELKNWFAELAVDHEKIWEIMKIILNFYSIWKTFDEKEHLMPILQKMPRPSLGPQNSNGGANMIPPHSHNNLPMNGMGGHQNITMGPPQMGATSNMPH
uniref:Cyclin-C n=1 Tax=Syphacia muris TaxID=451379 RepID=A0A0N5AGA0_9BILA